MTLQPSKHFLPLIFPVLLGLALFADLGSALTLSADDSGSLLKYRYGIAVLQSNPLVAGERGGSDGHIGEGFTDFDHGYCLLSRSGTGNLGGECELPNSRDLGATYMVVKVQGWATCTGVVNRSSGYITLPGARSCNGSYSMESIPTPLHQLKGIGRGNMNTEGTTRATMNMEFRAKTGLVEYVGTANRAFIKFDLSRIRERFFSAQLNLFVAGAKTDFGSADGVIGVYAIDDFEALDEKDFDVQPLSEVTADFLGALGGEAGAVSTGYQSIDVTRAVFDALDAGKPSVSFLLKNSVEDFDGNSRFVLLGSHSSEYPPLLELKPNSSPVVQVSQPNGAEVLSDTTGQALLAFRFSDPDFNQRHTADVFLSEAPGQKGEPLVLGVSLDATHCMPEGPGPGGPRPAGPRPDGLGQTCSLAWSVPAIQKKAVYLDVVVRDDAGAEALDSSDNPFTVDGLPPQNARLKIQKTGDTCFVSSPLIDLALEADDVSPMQVAFSCDNQAFSAPLDFTPLLTGFNLARDAPGCSDADGNKLVFARFTDSLGHATTDLIADTIYLDRDAPRLAISSPADGATLASSTVSLSFDAVDQAGIQSFAVKADDAPFVDVGLQTSHLFSGQSPGFHAYSVRAYDNAGNFSEKTVALVLSSDPVPEPGSRLLNRRPRRYGEGEVLLLPIARDARPVLESPAVQAQASEDPGPPQRELQSLPLHEASCLFESGQAFAGGGPSLSVDVLDSSGNELFPATLELVSASAFRLPPRVCALLPRAFSLRFEDEGERGVIQFSGANLAGVFKVKKLSTSLAPSTESPARALLASLASSNSAFALLALGLLASALLGGALAYWLRRRGGRTVLVEPLAMSRVLSRRSTPGGGGFGRN